MKVLPQDCGQSRRNISQEQSWVDGPWSFTHAGSISAVADRSPPLNDSYRFVTLLIKSLMSSNRSGEYCTSARSESEWKELSLPIASGLFSALSPIHFWILGWTCRHFWAICCVCPSQRKSQSSDLGRRRHAHRKHLPQQTSLSVSHCSTFRWEATLVVVSDPALSTLVVRN